MDNTDHNLKIIEKVFKGLDNTEEERMLSEWLDSAEGRKDFESVCQNRWLNSNSDIDETIKNAVLKGIESEIGINITNRRQIFFISLRRIAAVLLFLIMSCAATYWYANHRTFNNLETERYVTTVSRGQKAKINLPDGSEVWLNSGAKFYYTGNYDNKDRRVYLEGEAYFKVAKNEDKPFTVQCNGMSVKALGTAFTVKGLKDDPNVVTSLLQGKVEVTADEQKEILLPNEQITFNRENGRLKKGKFTDDREVIAWMHNTLYFKNTSLKEIAQDIERMYGTPIIFDKEEIGDITFSGSITNTSMNNILNIVSMTYPIDYKIKEDVVIISEHK